MASELFCVRTCVIFNPAAKGQKADRFRRCLDRIGAECVLKTTSAPGDARRLAAAAIHEGFDTLIAAGGDGTLNEVLNGLGDAPDGFKRARLGILPLGTVNVFARELGIPLQPDAAWDVLRRAREERIDLAWAEYGKPDAVKRHYFAQMAGAGLDARAIALVNWPLKKKLGPLAYVISGLRALLGKPADITISTDGKTFTGQLVLIGNGRLYGGSFRFFPQAEPRDGLLDVCVFPRANWLTLLWCGPTLLLTQRLPEGAVNRFRAESFRLSSTLPAQFEVEGELIGHLPAVFSLSPVGLRVLVPPVA
ncbi:MAG: diacylglycerol kinase family lipid kinase [Verrucomicrobia bacterium]|nr:diacylglycerol kinase family lipid kinase [Verrucomicrobiota bacterium]